MNYYPTTDDASTAPFFSVQISCRKHVSDMLSEALLCFGATSTSIESCQDNDEICINSIFTECQDVNTCISHAADSIGLREIPNYKVIVDDTCKWIEQSQESFRPVEVTDGLWIVPEWTKPPDVQATNIILNPGLAFGTGDHPTTRLCLLLLHGLVKGGEVFLDYGTGSGILGIAAIKLGASLSVGIDIDPKSIASAQQNATLNNIEPEKMQIYLVPGDNEVAITKKYDIVIANILLNPLLELADEIVEYAKPGGIVGLSGILSEQLPKIEDRYSPYMEKISVSEMDGWVCICGTKRSNI
ncbi:hypothetical protein ACHQM5_003296 [Ranunculus cassubicifolius]